MRSPSPSDLCWVIGFTPQGHWIAPILRAAVRAEWPDAQQIAATRSGDASLAHELMEQAIEETKEGLEAVSTADVDEARQFRHYRNAVQQSRADRVKGHFPDRRLPRDGQSTAIWTVLIIRYRFR
jgi:hypothetical protein